MTSTDIKTNIDFTTCKVWFFIRHNKKHHYKSIECDPRSGRPSTVTSKENITKVCNVVLNDRRMKVREIIGTVSA
jgi:hypothetical protein